MPPFIHVRCAGCNARIKSPTQLIGQTRNCPGCGRSLLIRMQTPEDAAPVLFGDDPTAPNRTAGDGAPQERVILLVDDDRELNDGLRSLLERQGHRVIQAFDGVEARSLVSQLRPDLMVLDMMMPQLGGYPVLEYLQEQQQAPPVIMITAKEGAQHKVYAEYLGVVDYLNKPFPIERFLESVARGLSGKPADGPGDLGA
jgi:CheY-like chemotaxis protein